MKKITLRGDWAPLQEFVCQAINMPLTKKATRPSAPSRRAASKRGANGRSSAPIARAKKPNAKKSNGKKSSKK
jgi:hypothetical protein